MARINIDDAIYRDDSFIKLILKVQSKRIALGMIVEAFSLAQKFYLKPESDRLIPFDEWKRNGIADELLEVGLAEVRETGIYVRGSSEQFDWLVVRAEAGRKGGKKTQENNALKANVKQNQAKLEQTEANEKQTEASPSIRKPLTPTLTLTHKEETTTTNLNSDILKAWGTWKETQEFLKIPAREISQPDELNLARAIKTLGIQNVLDALEGARYETASKDYDPKKFLSLDYCLHRNIKSGKSNWDRLGTLARIARDAAEGRQTDEEQLRRARGY